MMGKYILATGMMLSVVFGSMPAQAEFFHDVSDWVKKEENEARSIAGKVISAAEASAEVVGKEIIKETTSIAREADKDIKIAEKAISDFVDSLEGRAKSCNALLNAWGGKNSAKSQDIPLKYLSASPPIFDGERNFSASAYMGNQSCKRYATSGFTCGIFPYLDSIARSIKSGNANLSKVAQYVGRAFNSQICSSMPLEMRVQCAIVVAEVEVSKNSASCVADVMTYLVQQKQKSDQQIMDKLQGEDEKTEKKKSGPTVAQSLKDNEEEICTKIGEIGFSFAMDYATAGAAETVGGGSLKKAVELAQLIRTAINSADLAGDDETIKKICDRSAAIQSVKLKQLDPTMDVITTDYDGEHLLLMAYLDNPKCMQTPGYKSPVQIEDCNGHNRQRWSFVGTGGRKDAEGYQQLRSDHYSANGCLTSPATRTGKDMKTHGTYIVSHCETGNHRQMFKAIGGGLVRNRHTGNCLNISGGEKGDGAQLIDWKCENVDNEIWYVSDPATDLLRGHGDSHVRLYLHPDEPKCLDSRGKAGSGVAVKGCQNSERQRWSFNGKQIWNDHGGAMACLTVRHGKPYTTEKCVKGNPAQTFEIVSRGRLKNMKTGNCLQTSPHGWLYDEKCYRAPETHSGIIVDNANWYAVKRQ